MALPPRASQLMRRQHGAISRRQLAELGVSDDVSTSMVRRGVLERVHRGVYRLPGGAVPAEQAIMAAVLRSGPGARASGPAACWLHGLEGFERLELFVLIPASRRVSGIDFPILHGPAAVGGDRARVRGVPAVSVARALLDAAPVVPAKRLRVAIDDARSRNLLTDERLRRRAQDLGRHRGAVIVRRLFAVGALAQRSEGERLFASVLAGLRPRPLYNVEILPGIRVDALDVEPALVMEYDGREDHSLPAAIDADHQRQFLIQDAGYEVRRISYSMVSTPAARERTLAGIRRARERRLALLGAGRVDLPSALP